MSRFVLVVGDNGELKTITMEELHEAGFLALDMINDAIEKALDKQSEKETDL